MSIKIWSYLKHKHGKKHCWLIGSNQKQFRTLNQKEVFGHPSFADHEIIFYVLDSIINSEFIVLCVHHSKMYLCSMVTFIIESEPNRVFKSDADNEQRSHQLHLTQYGRRSSYYIDLFCQPIRNQVQ